MNKDAIYSTVKKLLIDEFGVQSDLISPEKLLSDELDIDSLAAVDILIHLEDHIAGKPDPGLFRNVRTMQDLVDMLFPLWKSNEK
jgi:acyl carrier protein